MERSDPTLNAVRLVEWCLGDEDRVSIHLSSTGDTFEVEWSRCVDDGLPIVSHFYITATTLEQALLETARAIASKLGVEPIIGTEITYNVSDAALTTGLERLMFLLGAEHAIGLALTRVTNSYNEADLADERLAGGRYECEEFVVASEGDESLVGAFAKLLGRLAEMDADDDRTLVGFYRRYRGVVPPTEEELQKALSFALMREAVIRRLLGYDDAEGRAIEDSVSTIDELYSLDPIKFADGARILVRRDGSYFRYHEFAVGKTSAVGPDEIAVHKYADRTQPIVGKVVPIPSPFLARSPRPRESAN